MRIIAVILLLLIIPFPVFANFPSRIISGIPSVTEMLFALDLGDQIVGVTTNCNYPPEAARKEKIGGFTLNLEKIVSLKPDLIVLLEDAQKPEIQKFKKYGLPVFTINPKTVKAVMNSLLKLGEITGRIEKAERLVWSMKRRLQSAREHDLRSFLLRPKVLVVVGDNPLVVAGGGTFIDDIVKYAGGINAARDARGAYPQFSFESLLKEKPDLIIMPKNIAALTEHWRGLKARIFFIDGDLLSRPGPRVVEAVEKIAGAIREKK